MATFPTLPTIMRLAATAWIEELSIYLLDSTTNGRMAKNAAIPS